MSAGPNRKERWPRVASPRRWGPGVVGLAALMVTLAGAATVDPGTLAGGDSGAAATAASEKPARAIQEIPASQHGEVAQRVAGVELRIVYNRPTARGRELFGGLVPFGQTWNPGADQATRIELDGDVRLAGRHLPAGKYSLWAVPEPERWTLIFSRAWDVFHSPYPEGRDALRLELTPERGDHMETLALYFPFVDGREATLRLHWGRTLIDVPLSVPTEQG